MSPRFPVDVPKAKAVKTLERPGFTKVREREHIAMVRENPDGSGTPLTMHNHPKIKSSTLKDAFGDGDVGRFRDLAKLEITA